MGLVRAQLTRLPSFERGSPYKNLTKSAWQELLGWQPKNFGEENWDPAPAEIQPHD